MLRFFLFLILSLTLLYLFCYGLQPRERVSLKTRLENFKKAEKKITAKEYVELLSGKDKKSFIRQSEEQAKNSLTRAGNQKKYQRTLLLARGLSLSSFIISCMLQNFILAPVLGVGLYLLPLWLSKLYIYRHNRFISEELETALSLITTSYIRHNDLEKAISENIEHIRPPVSNAFRKFLTGLKYVTSDMVSELEKLGGTIDNKLFRKWCDTLVLCQSDHTLNATLLPLVSKFSDIKAQQAENETNMMMPLWNAVAMIAFVATVIPLLKMLNADWYYNLLYTYPGQCAMAFSAIAVFFTLNKAITLCQPIEYDV